MSWNKVVFTSLIIFSVALTASKLMAQSTNEQPVCLDVVDAMNFALQGMPKKGVTGISLKDKGQTTHMLFVALGKQNSEAEEDRATLWRLLQKQGDSTTYCLIGAGKKMEALADPSFFDIGSAEFGLPGSSKRRCNDETDGPLGSVFVRAWAAKELGPTIPQSLSDTIRGDAFVLMMPNTGVQGEFPWILIQGDGIKSCYFSRGTDSAFSLEFEMRPELASPPGTLPPIE